MLKEDFEPSIIYFRVCQWKGDLLNLLRTFYLREILITICVCFFGNRPLSLLNKFILTISVYKNSLEIVSDEMWPLLFFPLKATIIQQVTVIDLLDAGC